MMQRSELYTGVRNWMYRNARPLDLARWQYHFEDGSKEEVINILSSYQNEDGGFGHALEADAWNENSAPIQVFHAIEILREVEFTEQEHPLLQGMLSYLASGKDMEGELWLSNIPSNNQYPHAPWWEFGHPFAKHNPYNPTAGLAGFGIRYANKHSELYGKCVDIAGSALNYLFNEENIDMHTLNCYIALMEYLEESKAEMGIAMEAVRERLKELVRGAITKDTASWATSYVCKPSQFFKTPHSIFYEDNKEIAAFEVDFIRNSRNTSGVWDVTWSWEAYPQEWAVSKNWWKGEIVIRNMRYLKHFGGL